MRRRVVLASLGAVAIATIACAPASADKPSRAEQLRAEKLEPRFERLKPLHLPKAAPKPGDWIAEHPEPGQSVAEFRRDMPPRPTEKRHTIYLQPIGAFTGARAQVLEATGDFLGRFFGLPVKTLSAIPLSQIPAGARRRHPSWGNEQILTTYVMDLLAAHKPADAVALLGLTDVDLYPEPSWNFVFGEAAPEKGTGIWSIYRNGDPEASPADFQRCLARTMQTAAHELGHVFGVEHCLAYECLMNGSNSQPESDRAPLEVCPACLQKLCAFTGCDPSARFEKLAEFAQAHGFAEEAKKLRESARRLSTP